MMGTGAFQAAWVEQQRRPRVVIVAAPDKPQVHEWVGRLRPIIEQHAELSHVDLSFSYDFRDPEDDLVVVLGGDGSILQAARQMRYHQLPVLGVNLGRLGFLADINPEKFEQIWPQVVQGPCGVTEHVMLDCSVWRNGERLGGQIGLNEVALRTGSPYTMLQVDLYIDSVWATTYGCDGLILSTPIGSTAHNLSAGGPILHRNLQAVVISPISPHTLTMRPVVDTADRVFELGLRRANSTTAVVVDGRELAELTIEDRVRIEKAPATFKLISVQGYNEYKTLREKLGWSGAPRPELAPSPPTDGQPEKFH